MNSEIATFETANPIPIISRSTTGAHESWFSWASTYSTGVIAPFVGADMLGRGPTNATGLAGILTASKEYRNAPHDLPGQADARARSGPRRGSAHPCRNPRPRVGKHHRGDGGVSIRDVRRAGERAGGRMASGDGV